MARNTRATGSNNFTWQIGDSAIAAYVDSPILKEFHSTGRAQNGNYISFAELVNIGTFINFGYLGNDDSNFSSDYNKNLIDFIRSVDNHLKDLNTKVTAWEHGNSGFVDVERITINKSSLTLAKNSSETLTVTVYPSDATNKNVIWESTNPSVATVGRTTGKVTGISNGTTTIIATSVSGGKTTTIRVEVVDQLLDFYWYIGTEVPSSISNVQTDNKVAGWHKIGTSLNGFVLNTALDENTVVLNRTQRVPAYIVIPNELHIYNGLGQIVENNTEVYTPQTCIISGYKAYYSIPDPDFPAGYRSIAGPIIKE